MHSSMKNIGRMCVGHILEEILFERDNTEMYEEICCNIFFDSFTLGEYTKCNFDHS